MKNQKVGIPDKESSKDQLSREDIEQNIGPFAEDKQQRMALETPSGKNNGAKPAAYKNQRSHHP
ncbi:hypothetical protein EOD41_00620 [Mucilaginibacter limnophilus]|uniref:Uncharacterized protein n=1 Tax=Mucilaginibacter limnophilus TaxID=1932778 RepID=A0A3S2UR12_9SPHI|nr:hypothetical protein [Mucilaginibacter limnophilus]RVU02477.1 hypothetical protein EOD41_00620 [Mucilaginibacter limnophilus]